ncbi:hypothetical protein ACHAQJ_008641 [Trichoderma viride]
MSSPSTHPTPNKSNAPTPPKSAMNSNTRLKTATTNKYGAVSSVNVTGSSSYSLDRYLDGDEQTLMGQQQRPPPGVEQWRDGANIAEAEAKERILKLLCDFDEKFGSGGSLSTD